MDSLCSALEILRRGPDDDLVDFHLGRNSHFVELAQIFSGRFPRAAFRELRGNSTRRDHGAANLVGPKLHAQALSQHPHGEFRRAVEVPPGAKT